MVDLHRRTGKSLTIYFPKCPRKHHFPLPFSTGWYDYYTRLSDMGAFSSKMNRELKYQANDPKEWEFVEYIRYSRNTTTIQLTLIAALEAIIPNISTRGSINFHIIGAAGAEFASVPTFKQLLHLLPSLIALQLSFVGLNVVNDLKGNTETHKPYTPQCYIMCTEMRRSISFTA